MRKLLMFMFNIALFVCVGQVTAKSSELYFPPAIGKWETISPQKAGIEPQKLQQVIDYAREQQSSGFIILYRGRILTEQNWTIETNPEDFYNSFIVETTPDGRVIEDVASAQKSIVSFLAAIAREQGKLDIDRPVSSYIGNGWCNASLEQENKIRVRHLMSMTSGLSVTLDYQVPAGLTWQYNTRAYSVMIPVLESATGKSIADLTADWLTNPTAMSESRWVSRSWVQTSTDANGFGFAASARDLARFGLLILGNGTWAGQAILKDPKFLLEALKPSQNLNPNYGLLWWLNTNGRNPYVPADMISALGYLDRIVMIIPSKEFVLVRIGNKGEASFKANLLKLLNPILPNQ